VDAGSGDSYVYGIYAAGNLGADGAPITIQAAGDICVLYAGADLFAEAVTQQNINSVSAAGSIRSTTLSALGNVWTVVSHGSIVDSDIFAGVSAGADGQMGTSDDSLDADGTSASHIYSVFAYGDILGSRIVAGETPGGDGSFGTWTATDTGETQDNGATDGSMVYYVQAYGRIGEQTLIAAGGADGIYFVYEPPSAITSSRQDSADTPAEDESVLLVKAQVEDWG